MKNLQRLILPFVYLIIFVPGLYSESLDNTAFVLLTGSESFRVGNYSLDALEKELATTSNLPDPQLDGEYLIMPHDETNRWAATLSWGVEWPAVYGARDKEAKKRLDAAAKNLYLERINKLAEIKHLLLDYILCRHKLILLDSLSANISNIEKLALQSYEAREMSLLDVNKIKIETANIHGVKAATINEEAALVNSLSTIYGKDCLPLLGKMDLEFPEPLSSEIEYAKLNLPAVDAALAEMEVAKQQKKVSKMESLPSLTIGYKHAYEDWMHFNGAVLGISIPVFSSKGKRAAAEAAIAESEVKADVAKSEAISETNSYIRQLSIIKNQLKELEPLLKNIDYNTPLLKAYNAGLITLIDYLTEQNYYTTAKIDFLNLQYTAASIGIDLSKYTTESKFSTNDSGF